MRKTTFLWLCLAVVAGAVLFHTSQKVSDGRQHLANLQQNIKTEEESLRVLQAEWSYLNQPERLEKLAKQYLELAPMNGRQFAKAQDIAVAQAPLPAPEATPSEMVATKEEILPVVKIETPVMATSGKVPPKIIKPASPPSVAQPSLPKAQPPVQAAVPAKTPVKEASKDFGDLMKSLGVQ